MDKLKRYDGSQENIMSFTVKISLNREVSVILKSRKIGRNARDADLEI